MKKVRALTAKRRGGEPRSRLGQVTLGASNRPRWRSLNAPFGELPSQPRRTVASWRSCSWGARVVNMGSRRGRVLRTLPTFETVTFGEVTLPPITSVAFLLAARCEIVAEGDRRKSAIYATLRASRRVAALSVCNASSDGPTATPRVTSAPPPKTLKLSASRG